MAEDFGSGDTDPGDDIKAANDIRVPDEVLAALQEKVLSPALALKAVMRDISREGFDYWSSEIAQEGVSQSIERLKSARKGVLLVCLVLAAGTTIWSASILRKLRKSC